MSLVLLAVGLAYIFGWGSVVEHVPDLWISPTDLWTSYFNSSQFVHGHFGAVYEANDKFVELPGILIALAPLAALSGSFHTIAFKVIGSVSTPAPSFSVHVRGVNIPFLNPQEISFGTAKYVLQPTWTEAVVPYAILLSCIALFACDALAERLDVSKRRRAILCVTEAFLLFNVTVLWGHPEDAVAVAFAVYALIFALDERFTGSGWLFGIAVVFQPLVLLMLPVLLAMAGPARIRSMALRSAIPAVVLILPSLIANFGATAHALVDQPSPPRVNHVTPWTALSPNLGGGLVAAGPIRLIAILLAVGLGIWAYRQWRDRPELLVLSCAIALALRSYTESVMTPYYAWAAIAVALVVAARGTVRRFGAAVAIALATTVVAQWTLEWFVWWVIQVGGVTALLILASNPMPVIRSRSELRRRPERGKQASKSARPGQRKGTGSSRPRR